MNVYFDTSAAVPLVIDEPASRACYELWNSAGAILSTPLLLVEASAVLNRARRGGHIQADELPGRLNQLEEYWSEVRVLELDEDLLRTAATYTGQFNLRAYDAVHCAAGARVADDQTVLASGDVRLLAAWNELGFHTFDPNG